jgi:mRNA-degrading endonuclease RelE of RelBE toxin-antitoxin system
MVKKQRNVIIFYKHKVNKYKVIDQINVNKNVLCYLFYIKRKTLYKKTLQRFILK